VGRGWKAPEQGMIHIRVDGGISRNGEVGAVAAVCRDHTGNFRGSSTVVYPGITDPACLEMMACREAQALAQDLMFSKIVISGDSKNTISDIGEEAGGLHSLITSEIVATKSLFEVCNFIFEGRNYNPDAHYLAKFATSLNQGRHLWIEDPHDPTCIPRVLVMNE